MSEAINLQVPSSFIGPGAIENIGELIKKFKSKTTLVITDPVTVKSGIISIVKERLDKVNASPYSNETHPRNVISKDSS